MISIIVPVKNEAPNIRPFLRHLRCRAPAAELIVIDGGSHDATQELASDLCDVLISSAAGRGIQMNAGVQASSGDVLWFLHADCEAPPDAVTSILTALDTGSVGGCFRVLLPDPRPIFRIHDSWAHWIGKALRVRCGDHGIFCTRKSFHAIGGYNNVLLMEDVDLVRGLHTQGAFAWLSQRLILSTRRHDQVGPYWYTFVCASIVALYCMRLPNDLLAQLYSSMVADRSGGKRTKRLEPVEAALFAAFRDSDTQRYGSS